TVIVGGVLRGLGTNARLGGGELLIAEADEYDRSFLKLTPTLAVITALEEEHLDTYGTYENLQEAFINFANSVPFYGMVIICCDDPNLTEILPEISRPVMTYGFSPHADLRGDKIHLADISRCEVYHDGQQLGTMEIPIPGKHNLSNALAAVAVARELEIPFEKISEAFKSFEGVKRRFELRGSVKGINIYDDYAHHPTEVSMTLNAAKKVAKNRIVAVFQPHLYSRTQAFSTEFAQSLMVSDLLIVTDIYPAREKPIEGVNAGIIVDKIKQYGHKNIHYVPNREDIAQFLVRLLEEGDTVITLGAGNIYQASDELLSLLGEGN
ncbi:MAG: UDP-N-acetylmuramate--L-alanine ligase, partial [Candidatus Electryonea clarkiae]|nr:UDP-N-acetylmuramate--L-alanine ligase [Candidatus Electryonea clarkiae]